MAEAGGVYHYTRGPPLRLRWPREAVAPNLAAIPIIQSGWPANHPANHNVWDVRDVGHDADKMLTSSCKLRASFDLPGCALER
ncbi:hypothetical protein [Bradyrhizobium sp.]|uniref:hypothetical protein n=1 Tax=Bradyrhizobium sp. TaxID=376 RepID=UPI003C53BB61